MKKVLCLFCLMFAIVLLTACNQGKDSQKIAYENDFISIVKQYYEANELGEKYPPFSCTQVTIQKIADSGIDVDKYVKDGCDINKTSAFVVVTDSSNPSDIKYEIVPNLNCKNYKSVVTEKQKSLNACVSTFANK